jgi:lysophospholipase L1-like esterase
MSTADDIPAIPEVRSPGMLGTKVIQDEFRDRFDKDNALLLAFGVQLDCVYVGDSLTAGWPVQDLLRDIWPQAVNRGVGGDSAHWLKFRVDADVVQLRPRYCCLMIGTNDIAHRFGYDSDEKIVADYVANMTEIVSAITEAGIRPVLGTIPPVCDQGTRGTMATMYQRKVALIPRMNAEVARLARESGGEPVDYFSALLDADGSVREECYRDQCHFNAAGQARMTAALRAVAGRLG